MHRVEQVDPTFTYSRKPVATNVPDVPELGESLELNLMPWHLSFDPSLSLKGKSKMVYIKTCVTDFLELGLYTKHCPFACTMYTTLLCLYIYLCFTL